MIKYLLALTLFFNINYAFAKLSIGLSSTYTNINDPIFNYVDKPNFSLSVGSTANYNDYLFTVSTNRLLNQVNKFTVKNNNNLRFRNENKIITDTLQIGLKRQFTPTVFLSNVSIKKKLYFNDNLEGLEKKTSWVYGIGLLHFFNESSNVNLNLIMPNTELDLEGGFSVGVNYLL